MTTKYAICLMISCYCVAVHGVSEISKIVLRYFSTKYQCRYILDDGTQNGFKAYLSILCAAIAIV